MSRAISLKYSIKKVVEYLLYSIVVFQETDTLEKLYTIDIGVNITPVDVLAAISISLLLVYFIQKKNSQGFKLDYYLAINFSFITILIGTIFSLFSLDEISITSYIRDAHYYIYIIIYSSFLLFSKDELTKILENIIKIYAIYIVIFLVIYILDKALVVEYSYRVSSRTDLLLIFLLFIIDDVRLDGIRYKGLIKVLFLIKLSLSFSRGLFLILASMYLIRILLRRNSGFKFFKELLVVLVLTIVSSLMFPDLSSFFIERFSELFSDDGFALENTHSFQAKIADTLQMQEKTSLFGSGLGSTILIDKGWAGYVNALYSDSLLHTLFFKFGTIFGLVIVSWYAYLLVYNSKKIVFNSYSILALSLFLINASMIYWRAAIMILFIVFVMKTINNK